MGAVALQDCSLVHFPFKIMSLKVSLSRLYCLKCFTIDLYLSWFLFNQSRDGTAPCDDIRWMSPTISEKHSERLSRAVGDAGRTMFYLTYNIYKKYIAIK